MCLCCSEPVARVLLFNNTGERDSAAMLKLLVVSVLIKWGFYQFALAYYLV